MTGCSDHGCIIEKPKGMGTNGGCRHVKELMHTEDGRAVYQKFREQTAEITQLRTLLAIVYREYVAGGAETDEEAIEELKDKFIHELLFCSPRVTE